MTKKILMIFLIMILAILSMSNIVKAATDYTTIIMGNDNQWIQFPGGLTKSWVANWEGNYTYSGTITSKITSENTTFQIQYSCIEKQYIDEIQQKSDQTPNDNEFYEWLNNYAVNMLDEDKWINLTNMKINLECILGEEVEHEHLVFVKVLENNAENVVWQGYGAGFSRISESREKVTLERIEITTPPTKTDYEEGELFDTKGMVITAKYSDDSSKIVTNYTYTPQTALNVTDTVITIVYTENETSKEVMQPIKVTEKVNVDKVVLESIEIATPPTKTDYEEGELFDAKGMVIIAKYSDGSSKIVTNYTYEPQTALKSADTTITIIYKEDNVSKEVKQEIKVIEKEDETIAKENIPNAGNKNAIIFIIAAVMVTGVVVYSRHRKMKDIL